MKFLLLVSLLNLKYFGINCKVSPFPSCTCGKCVYNVNKRLTELQARESIIKFLMGVNDSLSQVRTQVLLMDPLPSLDKVYDLLIQEEVQRTVTSSAST